MRLWHKDLIPYLPRQQLVAQWRECCCIARNIYHDGAPNHLLVNKILDYPDEDFNTYTSCVIAEMQKRGYSVQPDRFWQWRRNKEMSNGSIFEEWHHGRYMGQCIANLEEKHDCGGISDEEWWVVQNGFEKYKKKVVEQIKTRPRRESRLKQFLL